MGDMPKPVSLSVHRNNRAQREAKRVRQLLKGDMKLIAQTRGIAGYAIVGWDSERTYKAAFYTPRKGPMPSSAMPDYVKNSLLRELINVDIQRALGVPDHDPDDEAS